MLVKGFGFEVNVLIYSQVISQNQVMGLCKIKVSVWFGPTVCNWMLSKVNKKHFKPAVRSVTQA